MSDLAVTQKKDGIKGKIQTLLSRIWRDKLLYLLLAPMIIWVVIFKYKPLYGLQIAFKDYSAFKGIAASPWNENIFEHFITFFTGPFFYRTLRNTFMINILNLAVGFPAPIILALLLNEIKNMKFKKYVQTTTYLPHFISAVVVAGIVINFLSPSTGIVNILIGKVVDFINLFGADIEFEGIYFLIKPELFRGIFVSMNIWKEAGFGSIVFLAALSGIDPQLYEVAKIDGANKWKQMLNVTLPGIMPTIMIMLIIRIGNLVTLSFEKIILLYNPSTYETADVIGSYVYRAAIESGQYDLAAAVGLFESVVAFVLVVSANRLSKRVTRNSLW